MQSTKYRISEKLETAREFENRALQDRNMDSKPSFHVSAPVGWINDPNGFSMFKGEYHLFYQYHPYTTQWGPMHWGHSKSKDLISWEQLPIAIAPDMEYDGQGCFSGSAIEWEGKQVLVYTGVKDVVEADGTHKTVQTQNVAIGNGIDYEKLAGNPVIRPEQLPKGSSQEDFRDPKIWRDGEYFYLAVGSRSSDSSGQIVLFRSESLEYWEYCGILDESNNKYGKMWECPDFFDLDGKQVLLVSPQEMMIEGLEFHNGHGTVCVIGSYQKDLFIFEREQIHAIDYGLDFYAPQTLQTEDGRRIMIAWMQSWGNYIIPKEFAWSGMMTIPRELHVQGGRLIQNPIKELEEYRRNPYVRKHVSIEGKAALEGLSGREIDMTLDITNGEYRILKILLARDSVYYTSLIYDAEKHTLEFDRTYSGIRNDVITNRKMLVDDQKGRIRIRLLLDKYSIEVFVNDGRQAMTSTLYTPIEADGIGFEVDGQVFMDIEKYDIVMR